MKLNKLVLALCIFLGCLTQINAQTADEIIDNYIKAVGGKEAWAGITSIKQDCILDVNGTEIKINVVAQLNKGFKQTVSLSGLSGFTIFTPTAGWNYYPWQGQQKPEASTPEDVREGQDNLDIAGPLFNYKEKGHKVEYVGKDDFEGTDCYKIKVVQNSGKIITYYIDPSNYFIIHSVTISKSNGQESESTADYSNYQKFAGGVWMALNVGTPGNMLKIVKTEINAPVDENLFKPTIN